MIHVLLVDEQRLFNEAVRSLLATEKDIGTIGMVTTGKAAIQYIKDKQPDVVLMDIHTPAVDGIKATIHIKDNFPKTKIIYLTSFTDKELVIAGMIAGADGFLLKDIDANNLIQSIRNAYEGQVVISGEAAKILATTIVELKYDRQEVLRSKLANRGVHLSSREVDVSLLLADGMANKHMASALHLSEGTIKNYISDIYSKLQVKSRKEAVTYLQQAFGNFYEK